MFKSHSLKHVPALGAAAPLLERAGEQASALAHRGLDAVSDSSRHLRDQARHASRCTVSYIEDEPVKAVLIAAAAGALLGLLVSLLGRRD